MRTEKGSFKILINTNISFILKQHFLCLKQGTTVLLSQFLQNIEKQ